MYLFLKALDEPGKRLSDSENPKHVFSDQTTWKPGNTGKNYRA
jgi:hypothetical protein